MFNNSTHKTPENLTISSCKPVQSVLANHLQHSLHLMTELKNHKYTYIARTGAKLFIITTDQNNVFKNMFWWFFLKRKWANLQVMKTIQTKLAFTIRRFCCQNLQDFLCWVLQVAQNNQKQKQHRSRFQSRWVSNDDKTQRETKST